MRCPLVLLATCDSEKPSLSSLDAVSTTSASRHHSVNKIKIKSFTDVVRESIKGSRK